MELQGKGVPTTPGAKAVFRCPVLGLNGIPLSHVDYERVKVQEAEIDRKTGIERDLAVLSTCR